MKLPLPIPISRSRPVVLAAVLALVLAVGVTATCFAAPPRAHGDVFRAVEEKVLAFSEADLLANDVVELPPILEIVSNPLHGFLQVIENDEVGSVDFYYTAAGTTLTTWDTFTYRLISGTEVSNPATVKIRVSPSRRPIAGRWETPSCSAKACPPISDDGHGAEIGWYHSSTATFELCDWREGRLRDCRLVAVPSAFQHAGLEPLVGDWDGDTWDEFAIFDSSTGALSLFDLVSGDFAESLPDTLIHLASGTLGPAGVVAVTGQWGEESALVPRFGFFDQELETFWLERPGGGFRSVAFGDLTRVQEPVIGDWYEEGLDHLALWNPEDSELLALGGGGPGPMQSLVLRDTLSGTLVKGQPFAGRLNRNSTVSFFGLYDGSSNVFRLFLLCDGGCGTLPLQILVDP